MATEVPTLKFIIYLGGTALPYEFPWGVQAGKMLGFDASGQFALLDPAEAMDAIPESDKGAPNGVATLDANGKLVGTQYLFGGLGDPAGPINASGQLPASQVPAATTTVAGAVKQATAIANIAAAPTQADFNGLLAALRTAGQLAT
jgi:hypothetical protein